MNRTFPVNNRLVIYGCEINFHLFIKKDTRRVLLAFFIAFALLTLTIPANAQGSNLIEKPKAGSVYQPAKVGTYQLIFNTRRGDADVKLSEQELMLIEKLRKDNEIVYARASYSDLICLKILPRKVITQADFKPVPLKYFKEENNYEEYSQIRYIEFE